MVGPRSSNLGTNQKSTKCSLDFDGSRVRVRRRRRPSGGCDLDDGRGGGGGVMVVGFFVIFKVAFELVELRIRRRIEKWVWFFETKKAAEPFEGFAHLGFMKKWLWWELWWLRPLEVGIGIERRNWKWWRRRRTK